MFKGHAPGGGWGKLTLLVGGVLAGLLLTEGILWVRGWQVNYSFWEIYRRNIRHERVMPPLADWTYCDEDGCRFKARAWAGINGQGFRSRVDFVAPSQPAFRVLVLGDSYAYGSSATEGNAFVDVLERELSRAVPSEVWNTGIGGTGPKQYLRSLKRFFPVLQPQVVILSFATINDFDDSLFPLDQFFVTAERQGVRQYVLDENLNPVKLSREEAYCNAGFCTPLTLNTLVQTTRLGSGIARVLDRFMTRLDKARWVDEKPAFDDARQRKAYTVTRDILGEIQRYTARGSARLLALNIPDRADMVRETQRYRMAKDLFRELAIETVEVRDLTLGDYDYHHWNNRGHRKAVEGLLARIRPMVRELADSGKRAAQGGR